MMYMFSVEFIIKLFIFYYTCKVTYRKWGIMKIKNSFDKFAYTYGEYNVIQKKIIKKYLPLVKNKVVDLGCGSEGLCKYKDFEFYLGVDRSEEMLRFNPCNTIKADLTLKSVLKF